MRVQIPPPGPWIIIPCMTKRSPYSMYKVYGPYIDRGQGRVIVTLVATNHRTSTSYARYLMANEVGRLLHDDEQVDHIDNDPMNNDLTNLRILTPSENSRRSGGHGVPPVELQCPVCDQMFRRLNQRVLRARRQNKMGKIFCSRQCASMHQFITGRSALRSNNRKVQ